MTDEPVHVSTHYRILFSAEARFANGGALRMTDFMLDWPDDRPDHDRLARAIVRNLNLLMVHDVEFHDVSIVRGAHKGRRREARSPMSRIRRLVSSDEVATAGVPVNCMLEASVVDVSGHAYDEVTALTLYGAWDGQPVLVISGLGEARVAEPVLRELHRSGLRWVVTDAPLCEAVVPVTVAPRFVASTTMELLEVAVVEDAIGQQRLVGVTADIDSPERREDG